MSSRDGTTASAPRWWGASMYAGPKSTFKPVATVPGRTSKMLSAPGKLPGPSLGHTAVKGCPWAKFGLSESGNQAICGISRDKTSCYADQGNYIRFTAARQAYANRLDFLTEAHRSPEARTLWIDTVTAAFLTETDPADPYARLMDAGDVISPDHILMIAEVVRRCRWIFFWLPTRAWRAVIQERDNGNPDGPWTCAYRTLCALPNIAVHPSALYVNEPLDDATITYLRSLGFADQTQVRTNKASHAEHHCPAPKQGGKCGNCRRCWTPLGTVYDGHSASFILAGDIKVNTRGRH